MANVDSSELAKFASRASEWWDPHGAFRTLHDINTLRVEYIAARTPLAGQRVLDVGGLIGVAGMALALTVNAVRNTTALARLEQRREPNFERRADRSVRLQADPPCRT